jgi:vacuolar-type H+-ATPase subunit H
MSDKIKAADHIARLAQSYQAVIDASIMLREIGSLEQARDEANKARDLADKEAKEAKDEAKKAKAVIQKAKDDAEALIVKASQTADEIMANAELDAERVKQDAKSRGEAMVSASIEMASRATGELASQQRLAEANVKALNETYSDLTLACATKIQEIEGLEVRLAKAQAQIAKLLG